MKGIVFVLAAVMAVGGVWAESRLAKTAWMTGKIGVFQHHLYDSNPKSLAKMRGYDAKSVVRQLKEIGASHFCITLLQVHGCVIAPNETYEQYVNDPTNRFTSSFDIPGELIRELKGSGIRFMLYAPGTPPRYMTALGPRFGYMPHPKGDNWDPLMTAEGARNWAKVFEEWSVRYGKDVVGWWIDGCFPRTGFNDDDVKAAVPFAAALRKGNPDSALTFNPGIGIRTYVPEEDYTAGEINEPFLYTCESREVDGRQWQMLTYLYDPMTFSRVVRYTDGEWIDLLRPILSHGGCVTLDCGCEMPSGRIRDRFFGQAKRIVAGAYGRPLDEEAERALAIERAVRCTTDRIDAANVQRNATDTGYRYTSYTKVKNVPDARLVRKTADGAEIWSDAIQASLDAKGAVFLMPRKAPYLLDRPIVLKSGSSLGAGAARSSGLGVNGLSKNQIAVLSPAAGYEGPLITCEAGATNLYVRGPVLADATSPILLAHAQGVVLREVTVRNTKGTAVTLEGVRDFRVDVINCDKGSGYLDCGVLVDAASSNGLVRNVHLDGAPNGLAVKTAGKEILCEAHVGRTIFTGTGISR